MLTGLILENFKAFGERQEIPLAPITLIYGPNSSGKSSIIQSILAVKQTLGKSGSSDLVTQGPMMDMGVAKDVLYQHDTERHVEIGFLTNSEDLHLFAPTIGSAVSIPNHIQIMSDIRSQYFGRNIGMGWWFSYSGYQRSLGLRRVDVYQGEPDSSVFSIVPGHESGRRIEATGLSGRINVADTDHPVWIEAYQVFMNGPVDVARTNLHRLIEVLRKALATSDDKVLELDELSDDRYINLLMHRVHYWSRENKSDIKREWSHILQGAKMLERRFQQYSYQDFSQDLRDWSRETMVFAGIRPRSTSAVARTDRVGGSQLPSFEDADTAFHTQDSKHLRMLLATWSLQGVAPGSAYFGLIGPLSVLAAEISSELEEILDRTVYVGPVRNRGDRLSLWRPGEVEGVGIRGEDVASLLRRQRQLIDKTNKSFEEFAIKYRVEVDPVDHPDLENVVLLRLNDTRTKTRVSIQDVGYGISQVLPIIVESNFSRNRVLLIEQPELHLHPALQANLGSLFADSMKASENQFIIETHSEQLLLRLQRLIREEKLSHEDVCVLYVDRDENGSHCQKLRIDEDGEFIDEWPDGFFEEGYRELFPDIFKKVQA